MATTGPKRRPDIYAQLRPRKTRARSGCLACRARRKKCDEAKPSCQACFRLQLKCTWSEDSTLTPMQGGQRADLPAQPQVSVDAESMSSSQYTTTDLERDESNVNNVSEAAIGLELYKLTDTLSTSSIAPYNDKIALDVRDHVNQKVGPEAAIIFDHFCHKTAPWMINGHSYSNPVLRFIVPLIARDELILNTVIAISGTHLAYTLPTVEPLATTYYALALQSLRSRLSEWVRTDRTDYQPLFAAIILLCHSEFISGNTYGAGLQHLRACREFVEVAIKYLSLPDEQDFAVFLLEHYGYFALVVNLRCSLQKDNIHLGLHFADHILPLIRSHPSFGSIFAFEPESLALIPQIALLAWQRYQDASQGDDTPLHTEYTELLERIDRERYPVVVSDDASTSDLRTVILIKTNTLLMLTHASFYECRGDHSTLLTLLQPLVENAVTLLKDVDETDACYGLFWSVLITGSYIQDRSQQDLLVRKLGSNQSQMSLFARGIELLQWMWHGQDRSNFGLSGLEKTAVAHGVEICIC